jgi:MraZ protein
MPSNRMAGVLLFVVALLGGTWLGRIVSHNAAAQEEVTPPCVAGPVVANEPTPWPTAPSGIPEPLPGAPVCTPAPDIAVPPTQVPNGHLLDQTVWNWMFEPHSDKLTVAGQEHLTHFLRLRPGPDPCVYVATAGPDDLPKCDPAGPTVEEQRKALDARRVKAVEAYLTSQEPGRNRTFQVVVHDPAEACSPPGAGGTTHAAPTGQAMDSPPPKTSTDPAEQPGTLALTDIAHLALQHVNDEIIIKQIQATHSIYKLSGKDIQWLKSNDVSDPVVLAMQATADPSAVYDRHGSPSYVAIRAFDKELSPTPKADDSQMFALTDIAQLAQRHISDQITLTQIQVSHSVYNLSTKDVLWLHANGASDEVIQAMQETAGPTANPSAGTLDDIAQLVQQHLTDPIIINQANRSIFKLSADDVVWLKSKEVSDRVILAMQANFERTAANARVVQFVEKFCAGKATNVKVIFPTDSHCCSIKMQALPEIGQAELCKALMYEVAGLPEMKDHTLEVAIAAAPPPPPTAEPTAEPPTDEPVTSSSEALPSGHYLQHRPQYFPPSPAFPLNRELAAMEALQGAESEVETVRPLIVQACATEPQAVAHRLSDPLIGTYPCKFEVSTGLALPAGVRDQLGENQRCLFVAAGPDKTIAVYTADGLERLAEQARSAGNDVDSVRRAERLCFSRLDKVKIDDAGNCVLPAALIRYAGITDRAVLVGVGDHFELWDAKSWDTWNDSNEQPAHLTPERVHGGIQ